MSFTFGTPAAAPSSTGFGFGTQNTQASTGLTFGAATPATTAPLNFGFGSTPATTAQAPIGGLLGSTPATIAASTPSLFGAPTITAPTLSFGATTTAGLSFGATSTVPASGTLTLGTAASGTSLLGVKPTTTTTSSRGLGGLDISVDNKGLSQGSNSPTAAKEYLLPNELMQTIEKFKAFVKMQKSLSSDITRGSARPLHRCAEDTASLMELVTTLGGSIQRDRLSADKLKQDTAKALQNAEIAQRTHDTPPGLQYENSVPLLFFMELAENFEHDLMLFRSQIETTEKHIQTMMTPKTLTPQELTMAMSKLHESLVAVAGKLQGVHSKVQQQKEQYLNFRKYVLKDNTNVFEDMKSDVKVSKSSIGKSMIGPTPFDAGNKSFLSSSTLSTGQPQGYETRNPLVWGNTTPVPSATSLSVGIPIKPPTASLNFNMPVNLTAPLPISESNSSFQLQKPPVGNKRGKH